MGKSESSPWVYQLFLFLNANSGWLTMIGSNRFYYTSNGGITWSPTNSYSKYLPIGKFKFLNNSTGYGLAGNNVIKTTDSGKVWERLPRDNDFRYLGFTHEDLHFSVQISFGQAAAMDCLK